MSLWFAAYLGLIQGLTEFLPISSTAHLRIAPALVGQGDAGAAYSAVIQLGTLLAVIVYFARDLFLDMPRAMLRDRRSAAGRLPLYIIAGTLPIVVLGLGFKDFITGDARSLYVVGTALLVVGIVMYAVDKNARDERLMDALDLRDAVLIGLAQACALVPGVSRSGATIIAALMLGMRRSDAARFSFLLGIPAIAGAGLLELPDAIGALGSEAWLPITVGVGVSFISGYASIAWLLRYLQRNRLTPFAMYRAILGIVILTLCIAGLLAPVSGP